MMQNAYQVWGLSALFKPISEELGFSRAATSVVQSIGRFEGGIEGPLLGWMSDKFGPRWIMFSGVIVFGIALILMNYIHALWAYYLVWGVMLGIAQNMTTTTPLRTAISNWFVRKRGAAQGTQMTLSGLSAVIGLPLITWLIITRGWRMTCVFGGILVLLVGLPLVWFFVKQRRPEYYGLLPDGAKVETTEAATKPMLDRGVQYAAQVYEVEFTLRQALRTPTFWLLTIVQIARSMAAPALNLHSIPFLTDIGLGAMVAAGMVSIRVLVGLPARFFGGVLLDRIRKDRMRFVMASAYSLEAIGTGIFLLYPTVTMIWVWFLIYGVGAGLSTAVVNPLKGRYFGRKAIGSITGVSQALITPAAIIAPIYFGWVHDTTGSYMGAFTLVAVTIGFSAIMAAFVRPPKPPAAVSDTRKLI